MRVLVTGSSGLLGAGTAPDCHGPGTEVVGTTLPRFRHRERDIRDRGAMLRVMHDGRPDPIVCCAAQPSNVLAADHDPEPRPGAHVCDTFDQRTFETHFPGWTVEIPLQENVRQLIASSEARQPCALPWAG